MYVEDLTNLEDNLKQHTDEAVGTIDLSDYATKDELPDLSDYATKDELPDLTGYVTK
jgi:hypothetical protein